MGVTRERRRPEFSNKEEHLVTGEEEKTEEKRYKNIRERETEREREYRL